MLDHIKLTDLVRTSIKAGGGILKVYESADFGVEKKADQSPLTLADKRSNTVIVEELKRLYPNAPILSEEEKEQPYEDRKAWESFWLVDPLDGTKEFIKRNGEFTTNIALVHQGRPVVGVIYAPVLDTMYVGKQGLGAFKISNCKALTIKTDDELIKLAEKLPAADGSKRFTAIASRSHMSEETESYINELKEQHGEVKTISAGSSLKLCLVAEGKANVYPRFAPTMEWDTGAGQAIVESAGGTVTVEKSDNTLLYNKENLRNPWFIAKR